MLPPPVRYGLAGVLGGLYGVMVSWVVNCTLVEISVNTFFAVVSRRWVPGWGALFVLLLLCCFLQILLLFSLLVLLFARSRSFYSPPPMPMLLVLLLSTLVLCLYWSVLWCFGKSFVRAQVWQEKGCWRSLLVLCWFLVSYALFSTHDCSSGLLPSKYRCMLSLGWPFVSP